MNGCTEVLWATDREVCVSWPDGTTHVLTVGGDVFEVSAIGPECPVTPARVS